MFFAHTLLQVQGTHNRKAGASQCNQEHKALEHPKAGGSLCIILLFLVDFVQYVIMGIPVIRCIFCKNVLIFTVSYQVELYVFVIGLEL